MTLADAMRLGGHDVPDYGPPEEWQHIVDKFWRLKQFLKDISDPITPGLIRDWCECQDIYTTNIERHLIYVTDYTLRTSLAEMRAETDRYFAKKQSKR